jgi:hypothetical protein
VAGNRQATSKAPRRAEEALRAAGRSGGAPVARARSLLSRIARSEGDEKSAREHLEALRDDFSHPLVLASATRRSILAEARELGIAFPSEPSPETHLPGTSTRAS